MGPLTDLAPAAAAPVAALLELLDRDGQVRQTIAVPQWPVRVGRALDNDVVLSDPHVAAHHFNVAETEAGLTLTVADTVNGVLIGHRRLRRDEQAELSASGDAIDLHAGRTHLRLRLPGQAVAPELALAPAVSLRQRAVPILIAASLVLAGLLFESYLINDPDTLVRSAGGMLLSALVAGAVWCGAWATLSKIFTRQAHFSWHVRVLLFAGLALMVIGAVPPLLAFSFSWPWIADYAFVGEIAVVAGALYFHLLAVEPARYRVLKWAAVTCAIVGVGLTLWFNVQRSDSMGEELYMDHLFPPALRLAKPIATDAFITGLAPLKATLDKKAKEPGSDDSAPSEDE